MLTSTRQKLRPFTIAEVRDFLKNRTDDEARKWLTDHVTFPADRIVYMPVRQGSLLALEDETPHVEAPNDPRRVARRSTVTPPPTDTPPAETPTA